MSSVHTDQELRPGEVKLESKPLPAASSQDGSFCSGCMRGWGKGATGHLDGFNQVKVTYELMSNEWGEGKPMLLVGGAVPGCGSCGKLSENSVVRTLSWKWRARREGGCLLIPTLAVPL